MLTGFFMSHSVVTSELLYEIFISPFYNGVNVAERQVIVVASFTCTPINSAPPAVIAK